MAVPAGRQPQPEPLCLPQPRPTSLGPEGSLALAVGAKAPAPSSGLSCDRGPIQGWLAQLPEEGLREEWERGLWGTRPLAPTLGNTSFSVSGAWMSACRGLPGTASSLVQGPLPPFSLCLGATWQRRAPRTSSGLEPLPQLLPGSGASVSTQSPDQPCSWGTLHPCPSQACLFSPLHSGGVENRNRTPCSPRPSLGGHSPPHCFAVKGRAVNHFASV